MMLTLLFAFGLAGQAPMTASAVKITPKVVTTVGFSNSKEKIRQIAWSPDATQLYVQTYEPKPDGTVKTLSHYLVPVTGGDLKSIPDAPEWAIEYLLWKAAQASPDDPAFKIDLEQTRRKMTATSTPMAGDMARGGSVDPAAGTSMDSAAAAAAQTQMVGVVTFRLKGEVVGEFVNEPTIPGLTFGWGPKGSGIMAFADQGKGQLVLLDKTGAKKKVDGTKGIVTPSWSPDGSRLAFLEPRGKQFAVVVGDIVR